MEVSKVIVHLPLPSHVYVTSRYLVVPRHGSPNTEFTADRTHVSLPSHASLTLVKDDLASQFKLCIGFDGHTEYFLRPYMAVRTVIVCPASHFKDCISCSQMVTWFVSSGTAMLVLLVSLT